jgi:Leucine-rich repeat (LRR) protein
MKRYLLLLLALPLYASADVTFYSKCDYKGPGVALAPGDYTAREMLQFGIPQDSISAVDVPRGLTVTLYENDLFKGRYGTLKRSDPCLTNDRFDDIVSSISIRETFEVTTPSVAAQETRSNAGVTVYTECDYKGRSAILGEGDYNLAQLKKLGIINNSMSSLKVAEGYSVTLYENDFLRGRAGRLAQDHSCLERDNFGDVVSSVSVVRDTSKPVVTPKPVAIKKSAITLYAECDYQGRSVNIDEGEYTTANLAELGLANNSISSIRVSEGFQVELFENDFYRGSSGTLRQNDNCLIDDRFNDTISSLVVSVDPRAAKPTQTVDNRIGTTVFGHCNYKGGSVKLKVGKYDVDALAALRIKDNVISSFKVEKGFQVTMYDEPDFTGQGKVFTGNDQCLDDDRLNEKVSSLVVEPMQVAAQEKTLTQLQKPTVLSNENELSSMNTALECVEQYVSRGLCDSHRWANISQRCGLANVELMTDGYLRGHVDAGNCKSQYWDELARRVANPQLR